MTELMCPTCQYVENLEWSISAHGLVQAEILLNCKGCGHAISFTITFPKEKGGEPKFKIKKEESSYIG